MTGEHQVPVDGTPEQECPDPDCIGDHYWQYATYRRAGWVSYRSPVKFATHPDLKLCPRKYGRQQL